MNNEIEISRIDFGVGDDDRVVLSGKDLPFTRGILVGGMDVFDEMKTIRFTIRKDSLASRRDEDAESRDSKILADLVFMAKCAVMAAFFAVLAFMARGLFRI